MPRNSWRRVFRSPLFFDCLFHRRDPYWSFISALERSADRRKTFANGGNLNWLYRGCEEAEKNEGYRAQWASLSGAFWRIRTPVIILRGQPLHRGKNSRTAYRRYLHIQHSHSLSRLLLTHEALSLLAAYSAYPRSSCFNSLVPNLGYRRALCEYRCAEVHFRLETLTNWVARDESYRICSYGIVPQIYFRLKRIR